MTIAIYAHRPAEHARAVAEAPIRPYLTFTLGDPLPEAPPCDLDGCDTPASIEVAGVPYCRRHLGELVDHGRDALGR